MKKRVGCSVLVLVAAIVLIAANAMKSRSAEKPHVRDFLDLTGADRRAASDALAKIENHWQDRYGVMLVECAGFSQNADNAQSTLKLLRQKTGHNFGDDLKAWYQWFWRQKYQPHPDYAQFKGRLYERVDRRFREYFVHADSATIRLDEIMWGGVQRDGIPPLKNPRMLTAKDARYLEDSNVVFGVEINGDARAYPKRILAWHEMFKDTIGGKSVCGVYCTLCGSMIVYDTEVDGEHHELGTSGFLYRSNKLMYDHRAKSLWSTLTGEPVVGSLVGKNIQLKLLHVVTTTWGDWRRRHPDTKVLSPNTGHSRDYREGAAYAEYFATDELMFRVPFDDTRLKNKDEVLALRFEKTPNQQLAISARFLKKHPVHHDRLGEQELVVLTDNSGANRVYETDGRRFKSWDGTTKVVDEENQHWTLSEASLAGPQEQTLKRLPAHRAFWFGWHAAFPNTRLVDE